MQTSIQTANLTAPPADLALSRPARGRRARREHTARLRTPATLMEARKEALRAGAAEHLVWLVLALSSLACLAISLWM